MISVLHILCIGGQWYDSSVYGEANGAILIGRLYCTGSERNLLECSRDTFAVTEGFCTDHSFDVGIKCEGTLLLSQVSRAILIY